MRLAELSSEDSDERSAKRLTESSIEHLAVRSVESSDKGPLWSSVGSLTEV